MNRIDSLMNSVRLNTLSFTVVMMTGIMLWNYNPVPIMIVLTVVFAGFVVYLSAAEDFLEILKEDEKEVKANVRKRRIS